MVELTVAPRVDVFASAASQGRRVPAPWLVFFAAIGVVWLGFAPAFIADDSYFYLVIARNLALHGQPTFSQLFNTNGVHPAWAAFLGGYAWLIALIHRPVLDSPRAFALPSLVFLLWGTVNFVRAFERLDLDFDIPLSILAGFLSVFAVLDSEAHLSYFALSCLVLAGTRDDAESRWQPIHIGLAAALVFLARLDSVSLLAPLYLWYLHRSRSLWKFAVASLTGAAVTCPYLIYNHVAFGSVVPMSGWLKSSFPHIHPKGLALSGLASSAFGYNVFFGLVPITAAALIVVASWKEIWSHPGRPIIVVFAAGACLHALYMALYYTSDLSCYWYYVLPMTAFSLALGLLSARWTKTPSRRRLRSYLVGGVCGVFVLLLVGRISKDRWGEENYLGPQRAGILNLVNELPAAGSAVILYDSPGATAFYAPKTKVVQADMLMSNRLMFDRMVDSGNALRFLVDLIRQRGEGSVYVISEPDDPLLKPNRDLNRLTLFNPKGAADHSPIGDLDVGPPLGSVSYGGGRSIYLWKIAAQGFAWKEETGNHLGRPGRRSKVPRPR